MSLGAWETYGGSHGRDVAEACITAAFDLGVIHFDFANNYGHPPGNAEAICGEIVRQLPRDEIAVSTKAGYLSDTVRSVGADRGSTSSPVATSRCAGWASTTSTSSTTTAPIRPRRSPSRSAHSKTLVDHGKALYVGVSSYTGEQFDEAVTVAAGLGLPITIHQPYYNLLGRTIEEDLLPRVEQAGTGVIAFCPLASGLLTDKHLDGEVTPGLRETMWPGRWVAAHDVDSRRTILQGLDGVARARGQSLAQMAIAWIC